MKKLMEKEYHTLNEGIPEEESLCKIGMDTGTNREWLHFWIGHDEIVETKIKKNRKTKTEKETIFVSQGVHLNRKDAMNLIEEIEKRLF